MCPAVPSVSGRRGAHRARRTASATSGTSSSERVRGSSSSRPSSIRPTTGGSPRRKRRRQRHRVPASATTGPGARAAAAPRPDLEGARGGDGDVDAPDLVEQPLVLGMVDPGDRTRHAELGLGQQRHDQVGLVVAGAAIATSQRVGPASSSEESSQASASSHSASARIGLDGARVLVDQQYLWPFSRSSARWIDRRYRLRRWRPASLLLGALGGDVVDLVAFVRHDQA